MDAERKIAMKKNVFVKDIIEKCNGQLICGNENLFLTGMLGNQCKMVPMYHAWTGFMYAFLDLRD